MRHYFNNLDFLLLGSAKLLISPSPRSKIYVILINYLFKEVNKPVVFRINPAQLDI